MKSIRDCLQKLSFLKKSRRKSKKRKMMLKSTVRRNFNAKKQFKRRKMRLKIVSLLINHQTDGIFQFLKQG
jgi:hypothetical protein